MAKRIFAYILFGLGFITITFFKNYSGTVIPYPSLFWVIGFLCFLIGFLFLKWTPTIKEQKSNGQLKKRIEELKNTGEKILVDLNDCEIKEHNYTEERERSPSRNELVTPSIERDIQAWDALYNSTRNAKLVTVNQTIIIYTRNTDKFYSRVIPKDRVNLLFKLDAQKTTFLYVDKQNRENYYFDLDFLDQ